MDFPWGKSIKSRPTIRKKKKKLRVLTSHLKTLLSCIKTLEGSHHFQVNVKCLGKRMTSFVIWFLLTFLLCVIVLLSCQCAFPTLAGPVGPAFSVSSRSAFLCYAFACVFPSASFHLPTLGVQAAESGLTNYWKPFLFLPCYCDTVRPPLYFLRTLIMLS